MEARLGRIRTPVWLHYLRRRSRREGKMKLRSQQVDSIAENAGQTLSLGGADERDQRRLSELPQAVSTWLDPTCGFSKAKPRRPGRVRSNTGRAGPSVSEIPEAEFRGEKHMMRNKRFVDSREIGTTLSPRGPSQSSRMADWRPTST
jgi:hypothetical protein